MTAPIVPMDKQVFFDLLDDDYPASEFGGYLDDSFFSEVRTVADVLRTAQLAASDIAITIGLESDSEGLIDGATIGIQVEGFFVVRFEETKRLTDDREATGERAALAIKGALEDAYLDVCSFAHKKGLI